MNIIRMIRFASSAATLRRGQSGGGTRVRRRDFVATLIGAIAAWPCGLRATTVQPAIRVGLAWRASLSDAEKAEIAALANSLPSVDLDVRFDDGKTDVSRASLPALDALGKALSEVVAKEKATIFVIAVLEEAQDDPRKQELALRRAESVKQYLVTKFRLEPAGLVTVSVGDKPGGSCCVRVFNLSTKPKGD
jgi:hypothetical protein